ncbi:ATP phosphoribosyltransferase [bacterium]|nr:ATP phosphoribosyltransferase [bacterium]|tara:strand:+ start:2236 stop:3120 length:885 start_codon:yes stop_codon:yes gene_type:complete
MASKKLTLALPKGSLQEQTLEVFKRAGFDIMFSSSRSYSPRIDDPEIVCTVLRPQEIPTYVGQGKIDAGISGDDWIEESDERVRKIVDLEYAKREQKKIKWVIAVPKDSPIHSVEDLEGKTISTELVGAVKSFLKKHKIKAKVEFSWGATEAKPPKFADAIIELTETGSSLTANNLRIVDTVLESSTKLIASEEAMADEWKKKKIEILGLLLKSVVVGKKAVMIVMHVPEEKVDSVVKHLPKKKPTLIQKIAGEQTCSVMFTTEKKKSRIIITELKEKGCHDIVEFPINSYTRS